MEFVKRLMVIMLMVMGGLEVSMGVVYKVGDSSNWTTLGHYNYSKWSSSKTFQVGDTLLFVYSPTHHNVMEVSNTDYQSCNANAPMHTYNSGNDSIPLTENRHYYFLCGFPQHCQLGQKVDIKVGNGSSSMVPSPSPTMTPPPPPPPPGSSASLTSNGFLGMLALGLAIVAGFGY